MSFKYNYKEERFKLLDRIISGEIYLRSEIKKKFGGQPLTKNTLDRISQFSIEFYTKKRENKGFKFREDINSYWRGYTFDYSGGEVYI